MRSINAKRIAAVVTGAALLGVGLAFAGPVTFQNVPIISNSGQPVVQIVVGSQAKPSDGVAAANIAAAIGNLAYTSVPVTASINATQARSVLSTSVSNPTYSLTNQQVWLNESGATSVTGSSYIFSALIGSVLNQGLALGSLSSTKGLQTSATQYAFAEGNSITSSPPSSPYSVAQFVPYTSVTDNNNGGGVSFTNGFQTSTTPKNDNILEVTSAQFSALKSNYGNNGESEVLWLTGFPVYNQQTTDNQFELLAAGGAYQVVFNKPIAHLGSNSANQINVPISILGSNYTIINETPPSGSVTTTTAINGGYMYLASSLAPLQTVYVGHNISSGAWNVQLQDLGQPNTSGTSPASVAVYYNGQLTNTSSIMPGRLAKFNVTGHLLYLDVNQTFAGLYAYQKWAKLELYTNVFELRDGQIYNTTTNPGWRANLLWTNTTGASTPFSLSSIIVYNTTPTTLKRGQSFSFIESPSAYKLTFLGDTLGASQFDSLSVGTTSQTLAYQNLITGTNEITNITEPTQELLVTSQIPDAFTYAGQTSSSVTYALTPYELTVPATGNVPLSTTVTNVVLTYKNPAQTLAGGQSSQWINSTRQLDVQITGYKYPGPNNSPITESAVFSNSLVQSSTVYNALTLTTPLYNVTSIQIESGRALPVGANGAFSINVINNNGLFLASNVSIGLLASVSPGVLYPQASKVYDGFSQSSVIYNQQNGQTTNTFSISQSSPTGAGAQQYYKFYIGEQAVPSNTAAVDSFGIGIYNNTLGTQQSTLFDVNYSVNGQHNNVTYTGTSGTAFAVKTGFRSEKGSQVAAISPTQDTFSMAEAQDYLQFSLTPSTSNTAVTKAVSEHGPYTIGQATNIANVSIANVEASIQLKNSTYTISGIGNIIATPSVKSATTPVLLKSLSTTPLVVLDSQANTTSGSNLILIGSGYVNSLSQQLQKSYNISFVPSSAPIAQAYGSNRILIAGYYANQTTSAANSFIDQLYAAAASS